MNNIFSLKNKVVLVTGGYGYLGRSIVNGISDAEATVIVLGRSKNKFENCFATKNSSNLHFIECDVAKTASIESAYQKIVEEFGKIDVLINNAFYAKGGAADNMPDEAWAYTMDGVISSVHKCIREVLPYLRKNKGGRIINVASMYGMVAPDFQIYTEFPQFMNPPHYGAGKAAVIQLTKYFASLLGNENILVNSVAPGPFPSKEVQKNEGFIKALSNKNPLGRIGQPDELQGVFVFLSSDASSYITGQNIAVDGGWTII